MGWVKELIDGQILAVHAALLHTGEIIYFGGSQDDEGNHIHHRSDATRIYNNCNIGPGFLGTTDQEPHGLPVRASA